MCARVTVAGTLTACAACVQRAATFFAAQSDGGLVISAAFSRVNVHGLRARRLGLGPDSFYR